MIQNRVVKEGKARMAKIARNVYLEPYQLVILQKLAVATQVNQSTHIRNAIDAYLVNNVKTLKSSGINKAFLAEASREHQDFYSRMPDNLKDLFDLLSSAPEKK